MKIKIGGWTRIWMVLSALFLLFGVWVWQNNSSDAKKKADEAYKSQVDSVAFCADARAKGLTKSSEPVDKFMYAGCDAAPAQDEAAGRVVRDQSISEGNTSAMKVGFAVFFWPSAIIGIFFAAVGWIRSGFRRRA